MDILPAIDLIDGKCVRLIQGEYDKKIVYGDDPVDQAREFIDFGSRWLHVIDLDGAKSGRSENIETIRRITALGGLKVEVGGGVRDQDTISMLLDAGVERLIVGTRAVTDYEWFGRMCEKFPKRLAAGLDARGRSLATEGWLGESEETVIEYALKAEKLPIAAIIYTDITRDGMLSGPNVERTGELAAAVKVPVIAAGGVSSIDDIRNLDKAGVSGAIIGRAYYEGKIDIREALKSESGI
ncbi:1-(5-phosphoribosyl)-5-[(5-phosphoribosylamino)methylideneamino] imidazole-4-carboxamide isomerase [Limihaloglobus sulfuriphilus]|uniref:1-(5-phosphoribosyl)-5-[(5-phosphoribosylamino)methylideneamino] imidazole-4-carboxamide isomerase n=1 Tax=Limihaloglobus sulfuriphilus TaxID=1851148 RepID=A0A1Q2MF23_9BACT|nr:1-(5-phosphoribosyl)-5-[(5-phosphoribosylamino)methylideneamino]imidazole-4-carboxamide isomerase [Limihaloglobus sulfuriphilus]AQQ71259.1 1-(5-phosphoribosyl)-5-[(5-phosphoribosylamino)methylideneamino] imidazole-4-carboxamide isomerase [Limihaloglobus sulfuriphilus]